MFSWLVFITKVYTCIVYTPHVILTSSHFQRKVLSPEILFTWTASQMLTVFGQVDSCSYNEKKIQLILITFNILLSSRMYKHLIITFYYDILMLMFIISRKLKLLLCIYFDHKDHNALQCMLYCTMGIINGKKLTGLGNRRISVLIKIVFQC